MQKCEGEGVIHGLATRMEHLPYVIKHFESVNATSPAAGPAFGASHEKIGRALTPSGSHGAISYDFFEICQSHKYIVSVAAD